MFTVIVTLDVIPQREDEFLEGLHRNARATVADEPGCLRFDIHRVSDTPNRFMLYELYASERAFYEEHRAAPHYAAWRGVADRCVVPGSHINTFATPVFPEDIPESAP
jgi:autoinducer 2-degrading protein